MFDHFCFSAMDNSIAYAVGSNHHVANESLQSLQYPDHNAVGSNHHVANESLQSLQYPDHNNAAAVQQPSIHVISAFSICLLLISVSLVSASGE